jgi:Uma2 family endonuclease
LTGKVAGPQTPVMPVRPDAPPLTVEHYRMLPETGPRYQLVNGDLYMSPAPNRYHQVISRNLEFILMQYLEEQPLGELYHAPFDVYLSDVDVFQPDIIIVLNSNRGILTAAGAEGAPDFVVESLSPKTRKLDLEQKRRVYAREGVTELWIIDPEPQTVTVYRFTKDTEHPVAVKQASETLGLPLLPGPAVDLNRVFRDRV